MVNDSKTNGPFEYCPEVPRNMWRHAQERLELGMDQLITYNVGASLTMWDELPGQTAAEKKKHLQSRTYLSIRSDPARASNTLDKALTFDDTAVPLACALQQ